MRLTLKLATLIAALSLVAFVGCGDDSDTPKQDSGGTVGDTGGTTGDTGGTTGDSGGGGSEAGATGACTADAPNLGKQWGGKTLTQIVSSQVQCLADPNKEDCLVKAVKKETSSEISDGCLSCFAKSALCSVDNCAVCIAAPTGADCAKCRCGDNTAKVNCVANFETCAGTKSTTTCP